MSFPSLRPVYFLVFFSILCFLLFIDGLLFSVLSSFCSFVRRVCADLEVVQETYGEERTEGAGIGWCRWGF